jgi:monofunctional biosynthetic peptidoglycan transglycosylase
VKQVGRWIAGAGAIAFALLVYSYLTLPDVRGLATTDPETTAFMELRASEARAQGAEPRKLHKWVSYSRISPHLKRAVLVAEDAAFWEHDGVDYVELQKSIENDWARGQRPRGASTITQQLAKNLYLSPSRNPVRKLRELIIARRLEAALEKARIFELYLNLIEWGDGIYGVEAAAHEYFGTSAAALGPSESALLAGAIINPRLLNPSRPTPRLLRRQQIILGRMGKVVPPTENATDRPAPVEEPESEPLEDLRADPVATEEPPPPDGSRSAPSDGRPTSEPAPEEPRSEPLEARPLPFPKPSQ